MDGLYFECHITIEPVFDERLDQLKMICRHFNFKVADLLMQKRENDTVERSKNDTFVTGHSTFYHEIEERMRNLLTSLKLSRFKIWRYKIEQVVIDSRTSDDYNILDQA